MGDDFYLATSTFEWHPGVRPHHSRDLVRWRPLGGALDTTRLLDLTGCPDSGGVWAPNLSHADGLFHLVYSNVSTYAGGFTDCPNHLTTAPSIHGPRSDPVPLHARGFDASLFHDGPDSRLLNLVHDWRPGHGGSAGLEATRYDRSARRLVGEPVRIALPPQAGWIEGPDLYRRAGWYYLLTADGGTGYDHQVTVARSRTLTGPYERDPHGALITARHHPDLVLQKAGHGSLVDAGKGLWYLAYLVARPEGRRGPCVLGRETAPAPVAWTDDGWPRVPTGLPALEIPAPDRPADDDEVTRTEAGEADGFDRPVLGPQWSTLRRPAAPDWVSLTARPSHLRLHGGRSPQSLTGPSLVGRRVTSADGAFEATVEYRPRSFQHLAGITACYNTRNWYFLHVTADDEGRTVLRVAGCDRGALSVDEAGEVPLGEIRRLRLGLDLRGAVLRFRYATGDDWQPLGPPLDATVLSDEHAEEFEDGRIRALGFTGAFVGMWAWDLTGGGLPADFDEATWHALRQHREAPSSLPGEAVRGGLPLPFPAGRSRPRRRGGMSRGVPAEVLGNRGRHQARTGLGRGSGATDVVPPAGKETSRPSGGHGTHVVLEAAGRMPAYEQALGVVRPDGVISRVGVPPVRGGTRRLRRPVPPHRPRPAGGPAPVRAHIGEPVPAVLDGVRAGHQDMADRKSPKVLIRP